MPTGTLQIKAVSGHSGSVPGRGVQREDEVCKYIDVTTCIGCKACEVACVEWNGMPFQQTNFDNYPVVRMPESPAIDIHLVESDLKPAGIGEPGTALIGPAVANAVFAATGKRLRKLPLKLV